MKKTHKTTGFLALLSMCLPLVGSAQITSSSYYYDNTSNTPYFYYDNTSNTPYYPQYQCGGGFTCNNTYYSSTFASSQNAASQLNQTASVANAVAVSEPVTPQLPKTGGGGRALMKSVSRSSHNYGWLLAGAVSVLAFGLLFFGLRKQPESRFETGCWEI